MLKNFIRLCSFMFTVVIFAVFVLFPCDTAQAVNEFSVGDVVAFGSYPQTEVTDESLLNELNSLDLSWISYRYYAGDENGNEVPQDFMKYADVEYNGNRYRAVRFTKYRPWTVLAEPFDYSEEMSSMSNQRDYGYFANNVYWFKYEPLKWRVLDPDDGFLICENIIDAQAISNTLYQNEDSIDHDGDTFKTSCFKDKECTIYFNNYSKSSIRDWLNDEFYYTAFNEAQRDNIKISEIDNTAGSKYSFDTYKYFSSETTYDKVFLPSYFEVINPNYGFNSDPSADDVARQAVVTDYAKIQGAWAETDETDKNYGYGLWFLRTAGSESRYTDYVFQSGDTWFFKVADSVECGTRPAIKLGNLNLYIKWNVHGEEIVQIYSEGEKIVPPPTPEMQGYISTWNAEIPEFMPSESLEFTAFWSARTDTKYTLKTYTMGTDGRYTETAQVLEGMTGAYIRAQYELPENFVLNTAKSVLSGTIKADNSLVLKVYFDRPRYTLTTVVDSERKTVRYYYGADIQQPATPEKEGYKFIGWSTDIPEKMPAENLTVTALFAKLYSGVSITVAAPANRHIEYGETVILYANVTNMPENATIKWKIVEGSGVSIESSRSGNMCYVTSKTNGDCIIEAYVVNEYGNVVYDENGDKVCDREGISSEVNLWMIIVWIFKNLFRIV